MSVPPTSPQDTQAAIAVLLLIGTACCVVYWRMALRIILVLVIVLVVYGTIAGVVDVRSLLTAHHG
jgi:hypothetical protein